ncbi:MAG: hypothetical protein JRI80_04530 [Deltaproteobacteria bacterium]|nr:hypothetical protein [Deltaproteobacteria bacterium]
MAAQAGRAVNVSLTVRNWLIGAYIAEFELCGSDRASYGDRLLSELSRELRRQLYNYLAFYRAYPQIVRTVPAQLAVAPEKFLGSLSYSHFELLVALDDDVDEKAEIEWEPRLFKKSSGLLTVSVKNI